MKLPAHYAKSEPHQAASQLSQSQPVPLVRPVEPAAPYPIDALGSILGPAARAIMEHVQVPDALAAHSVLGFAALAAQAHANVQTLGGIRPLTQRWLPYRRPAHYLSLRLDRNSATYTRR